MGLSSLVILLLINALVVQRASSSNAASAHHHSGKLQPYDGSKLVLTLEAEEETKLDKHGMVFRKVIEGDGGRGIVIQDVNASSSACIDAILGINKYKGIVPHLKEADVYSTYTEADGTSHIKAKMKAGMFGFNFEYFLHMVHRPSLETVTWTLDYTRQSDIDDSVGHWQIESHPNKRGWTRVFYSTELALPKMIPSIVLNYLAKNVLSESSQWLKHEAERLHLQKLASEYEISSSATSLVADTDFSHGGRISISSSGPTDGEGSLSTERGKSASDASQKSALLDTTKLYKFPRFGFMAKTKRWLSSRSTK